MKLRFAIDTGQYTWPDIVTIDVREEDITPYLRALIKERLVNGMDVTAGAACPNFKIGPSVGGQDGGTDAPFYLFAKEATWESLKEALRKDEAFVKEELERKVWKAIGIDPIDPPDESDN